MQYSRKCVVCHKLHSTARFLVPAGERGFPTPIGCFFHFCGANPVFERLPCNWITQEQSCTIRELQQTDSSKGIFTAIRSKSDHAGSVKDVTSTSQLSFTASREAVISKKACHSLIAIIHDVLLCVFSIIYFRIKFKTSIKN